MHYANSLLIFGLLQLVLAAITLGCWVALLDRKLRHRSANPWITLIAILLMIMVLMGISLYLDLERRP